MDISLDAIKLPAWDPVVAAEWDEAFEKVENYLRACRVASRLHRARLTALILQRVIEKRSENAIHTPAGTELPPLSSLAIEEARLLITNWLGGLLPPRSDERPYTLPEGFLALYLSDAPMRWPNAFLNPQMSPPGFAETLHARLVKAGPELQISSMVPRPLDRGLIPDLADSAMGTFDRFPILRLLFLWLLFSASLIFLFWYTRHL